MGSVGSMTGFIMAWFCAANSTHNSQKREILCLGNLAKGASHISLSLIASNCERSQPTTAKPAAGQERMLRHEASEEDLAAALRMQQVEPVEDTRLVTFERGGKISVLPKRD